MELLMDNAIRKILLVLATLFCCAQAEAGVLFSENFDPVDNSVWTTTAAVGVRGAGVQGFDFGNAMHFSGFGERTATLDAMDLTTAETLRFDFRGGNEDIDGNVFWEDVDAGENAVVEYSTNGTTWNWSGIWTWFSSATMPQ